MRVLIYILVFLLLAGALIGGWIFFGSGTNFNEKSRSLYISSKAATKKAVIDSLLSNRIISNETAFNFLANRMDYWEAIKPGKYEVKKGTSLVTLVRTLRNGTQTPVDLVINKWRTKEDFARTVGRRFETDSATMLDFLNSADSLKPFSTEPEWAMTNVLPDTYRLFWNSAPSVIYDKLYKNTQRFWTDERKKKAAALGLRPGEVYTLASIIEEETRLHSEKDTIASVYLNRLNKGMPLQADPTLKFAARQFELTQIKGAILQYESPYNTYQNKGLPPGPICTPTPITIDKVLNAAQTPYLYFVAKPTLGGHLFSVTFEEHLQKARLYWSADAKRHAQDSVKGRN